MNNFENNEYSFSKLIEILNRYSVNNISYNDEGISFKSIEEDGFDVKFIEKNNKFYINAGKYWYGTYYDMRTASGVFLDCLSKDTKLAQYKVGKQIYREKLLFLENGIWTWRGSLGTKLYPFWKPTIIIYKQNNVIPENKELLEN